MIFRDRKYLDEAKKGNLHCYVTKQGPNDHESVVLCHIDAGGMGTKCADFHTIPLLASLHDMFDGRHSSRFSKADAFMQFQRDNYGLTMDLVRDAGFATYLRHKYGSELDIIRKLENAETQK